MKLSFVIPCYRSEKTIEIVVAEIEERMQERRGLDYEIVLVNDCSPDDVWKVIQKLAADKPYITGVNLAKNFGQHCALMAGYAYSKGEYVVSLDDDGQIPLESLFTLYDKLEEGYDVVCAYYREKKRTIIRKFGTWMANKMGEIMLGQPKGMVGSSFYIARRFVIEEMLRYDKSYPYLWGLVLRTTRNIACVETEHRSRIEGTSGYSFGKLLGLWINGFTAFSVKPLEWGTYMGVFMAIVGFVYALVTIIRKLLGADIMLGWSSTISILLIVGGMILVMLGLIGEYVGRIYICINNSPQYVVKETTRELEN